MKQERILSLILVCECSHLSVKSRTLLVKSQSPLSSAVVEREHHHEPPLYSMPRATFLYCLHLLEELIFFRRKLFVIWILQWKEREIQERTLKLSQRWPMTQGAPAPWSFAGGSKRGGWLSSFLPKIQGFCAEASVSLFTTVSEYLFLATSEKWECHRVILYLKFLHNFHSCYNSVDFWVLWILCKTVSKMVLCKWLIVSGKLEMLKLFLVQAWLTL